MLRTRWFLIVIAMAMAMGSGQTSHATGWQKQVSVFDVWDITTVEVKEVPDQGQPILLLNNDCSNLPKGGLDGGLGLGDIVNLGQTIWKIIEAGKPVVSVVTPTANALPRGLGCWSDLSGWHAPITKSYAASYKNLFGAEVVQFRFRLHYTYGGGKDGLGQYLANVAIIPADISVSWGYTFNAAVNVEQAVNLGTTTNPLAGLGINLKWDVKTVLKETQNSLSFFVQGDGQIQSAN